MWVLEIELGTSGGTGSALNCLAIFLAPNYLNFYKDNGKENVCPALTCSSPVGSVVSLAPLCCLLLALTIFLTDFLYYEAHICREHQIHCHHFGMVLV